MIAHVKNLPKLGQVVQDAALLEVIGHHSTARRQTGLNVGLDAQSTLYCLLGQQPCRDDMSFSRLPRVLIYMFARDQPAPNMTDGLLVLVQLVIAAMTTEPC